MMGDQYVSWYQSLAIILKLYNLICYGIDCRFISWNEFVTDMLSRGEVKMITVVPETETAIVTLHQGAVIKGTPVKVIKHSTISSWCRA